MAKEDALVSIPYWLGSKLRGRGQAKGWPGGGCFNPLLVGV